MEIELYAGLIISFGFESGYLILLTMGELELSFESSSCRSLLVFGVIIELLFPLFLMSMSSVFGVGFCCLLCMSDISGNFCFWVCLLLLGVVWYVLYGICRIL